MRNKTNTNYHMIERAKIRKTLGKLEVKIKDSTLLVQQRT